MKLLFVLSHNICLVVLVFMLLNVAESLRMPPDNDFPHIRFQEQSSPSENRGLYSKEGEKEELGMELYPTGSTLPDCSHACGPCFPCKRVMVSFKCSLSESCPIVYRCMCKGKYYHVPSN